MKKYLFIISLDIILLWSIVYIFPVNFANVYNGLAGKIFFSYIGITFIFWLCIFLSHKFIRIKLLLLMLLLFCKNILLSYIVVFL